MKTVKRKLANLYSLCAKPHLIQRVELCDPPRKEDFTSIDRYFSFSYMGSSEFEWGTLPAALKFMREDVKKWGKKPPYKLQVGEHTAWYVGPAEGLECARELFTWQLGETARSRSDNWYLQERTEIRDA